MAASQAPLSMGFSRQEDWSGLPYLSVGDLPNRGKIKPRPPALQADSLPSEPPGYTRDKVVLHQKRKDGIGGGGSSKAVSHNTTENLFLEMHSQRRNVRQTILRAVKRMERLS